jgi:CBS domain-containing protein
MKARDLMIPLYDYLKPDNNLSDAIGLMKTARRSETKRGVKALPVLDDERKLIGIVSMGDLLKAVFPKYLNFMELGEFTWDGMVEDLAKKVGDKKVSEIMSENVVTVKEGSALMECIDHMLKNNIKRLPVIGKDGKVIGMIYERDVFFAITREMYKDDAGGGE